MFGAARLRPEGLGVELPHMDAKAVAHWFLDRYPDDVRASDALEIVAKTAGNVIVEEGILYTRLRISEGKNMAGPLTETLPEQIPPTPTTIGQAPEAELVSVLTAQALFQQKVIQAQDGSNVLVLDQLPPQ